MEDYKSGPARGPRVAGGGGISLPPAGRLLAQGDRGRLCRAGRSEGRPSIGSFALPRVVGEGHRPPGDLVAAELDGAMVAHERDGALEGVGRAGGRMGWL